MINAPELPSNPNSKEPPANGGSFIRYVLIIIFYTYTLLLKLYKAIDKLYNINIILN